MAQHTPRVIKFLEEVTARYFKNDPDKFTELLSLLDSIPAEKTDCIVLFKTGAKKGTPCGKPCVSNQMCSTHFKKYQNNNEEKEEKEACNVLFKTGAKKGTPCGKSCVSNQMCSTHFKKSKENDTENKTVEMTSKKDEIKDKKSKKDKMKDKKEETQEETQEEMQEEIKDKKEDKKAEMKDEIKDKKSKKDKKAEMKDKDEMKDKKDEMNKDDSKETCGFLLKSGEKKGNPCGKVRCEGNEWCAIHTKSKAADKKKDEKEQEKVTFCKATLKNGLSCDSKSNGEQFCKTHAKTENKEKDRTLRVKRDGEYYLIKGTNVMFDMAHQCIIGYKRDNDYIFEENKETVEMCKQYDLSFK